MIKSNFYKIYYNIYLFDKVFITMQIYINILNILNLIIFYNFTKVQLTYIILINKGRRSYLISYVLLHLNFIKNLKKFR